MSSFFEETQRADRIVSSKVFEGYFPVPVLSLFYFWSAFSIALNYPQKLSRVYRNPSRMQSIQDVRALVFEGQRFHLVPMVVKCPEFKCVR
jgi:hypothetical protein